jgi:hypothetical protein
MTKSNTYCLGISCAISVLFLGAFVHNSTFILFPYSTLVSTLPASPTSLRILSMIFVAVLFFNLDKEQQLNESNAKVRELQELKWIYQQGLAIATKGEKWMLKKKYFQTKSL